MERKCYICRETKETTNFYRDCSRKSGFANKCKDCERKRERDWSFRDWRKNEDQKKKAHPQRFAARRKVQQAVFHGKLDKFPCEVCGEKKSQGHHEDYSKPLEVVWLCQRHHTERHMLTTPITSDKKK